MSLLPSKRRWTEEEEETLKRLYYEGRFASAPNALRRSVSAVRARAVTLGLIAKTPEKPVGRRRGRGSGIQTEIDGHVFDSRIEAKHYQQLKLREKAGEIRNLRMQVKYDLWAYGPGDRTKVGVFIADFVYEEKQEDVDMDARSITEWWEEVTVDVKPARQRRKRDGRLMPDRATPVYKLKAKLFRANYGKPIKEVRL